VIIDVGGATTSDVGGATTSELVHSLVKLLQLHAFVSST